MILPFGREFFFVQRAQVKHTHVFPVAVAAVGFSQIFTSHVNVCALLYFHSHTSRLFSPLFCWFFFVVEESFRFQLLALSLASVSILTE